MDKSSFENTKIKIINQIGVWSKVDLEAYKNIVLISEKKHEDVISESESMTTKSINMLSVLFVFVGSFSGYLISHPEKIKSNIELSIIGGVLFVLTIGWLISIILPRKIFGNGRSPENTIPKRIDQDTNIRYQSQMIFFNYLVFLQHAIDYNSRLVEKRASRYGTGMVLFAFTMLYYIIVSVYIIASPS